MLPDPLVAAAQAWISADPDPVTREQAKTLLDRQDIAELSSCFGARLAFGTAGIRGALGPGPGRMNRALVRQVSAGLGRYVLAVVPEGAQRGVVIGRDGRRGSQTFAEDAAAVLAGQGFRVWYFDEVVPTPILAHAVAHLGAAAGVMVTASHNPPEDNGYKVYWGNGAQIIPPHDAGISAEIDRVASAAEVLVPALEGLRAAGRVQPVPDSAWQAYVTAILAGRVHRDVGIKAVYTAMHGVGWRPLARLVEAAGHLPLIPVAAQVEPDGAFPTVRFPNPEEPGALDLALALARREGADLVIAHDPDADRLAVAIPDGAGGYRPLSGNEVGVLLADDLLTHGPGGADRLVATSIVSTSLLGRIAAAHGVRCVETLTGFKWIANAALAWPGPFVFGFEEALGYTVGPVVRDKDGLGAALAFLDLAAWCRARGVTLGAHLEALYRRYGYAAGAQRSLTLPGAEGLGRIQAMMRRLREEPLLSLAGVPVSAIRDVAAGTARDLRTGETHPLDLPRADVLAWDLADGSRVLARPSGTEPKIKFYVEVLEVLTPDEPFSAAEARARDRVGALTAAILAAAGAA